jgi:hypothetical protein
MKDFQHEQLFTELTLAEASVIEGGAVLVDSSVNFDSALDSRTFTTKGLGTIKLSFDDIISTGDGQFTAGLVRVLPGRDRPQGRRTVNISPSGANPVQWNNQPAGTYRILFRDQKDNRFVNAGILVESV